MCEYENEYYYIKPTATITTKCLKSFTSRQASTLLLLTLKKQNFILRVISTMLIHVQKIANKTMMKLVCHNIYVFSYTIKEAACVQMIVC